MKRFPVFLLFVCMLFWAVNSHSAGQPKMVIEQGLFDAGDFYRTGDRIEHAFVIKNTGSAELVIESATPG